MVSEQTVHVEVQELGPVKRKLTISVPATSVSRAISRAYDTLQHDAKLKGFRKGKVPRPLLEREYAHAARETAIEFLVKESYPEALTTSGVTPLSHPTIDPGPLLENVDFHYQATIEICPTIQVKEWSGLKLEGHEVIVEEHDVEEQVFHLRQGLTKLIPVDANATVEEGIVARVDFVGTADGKPFEGSDAKDFVLDVGSGNVLPAFEERILGMKCGETREVAFAYPEDYFNLTLAGSQAKFSVTVKDLKRKVVPEAGDEFAKELGDYQTMAEVRSAVNQQLKTQQEQATRAQLAQDALAALLAKNDFEVPESMVGWELQYMLHQLQEQLRGEGKTIGGIGLTPEAFVAEHEPTARHRVRQRLLLDAIATAQQLVVTEDDVEARLKQIGESAGETLPKVRLYYEQHKLIDGLKTALLHEKALDFVLERAKIKIKKVKKEAKG